MSGFSERWVSAPKAPVFLCTVHLAGSMAAGAPHSGRKQVLNSVRMPSTIGAALGAHDGGACGA